MNALHIVLTFYRSFAVPNIVLTIIGLVTMYLISNGKTHPVKDEEDLALLGYISGQARR